MAHGKTRNKTEVGQRDYRSRGSGFSSRFARTSDSPEVMMLTGLGTGCFRRDIRIGMRGERNDPEMGKNEGEKERGR